VEHKVLGPRLTLEFKQSIRGSARPWRFLAANMSDGTLRALGILVALFQSAPSPRQVSLVAVEEPEVALHPAAAGVLLDALRDASGHTQVLVTSHSPDLLDHPSIQPPELLSVIAELNETKIGPLDQAGRESLKDHLYTAGELLKMNQLEPDPRFRKLDPDQLDLLGEPT
jgi:predicted ATPase